VRRLDLALADVQSALSTALELMDEKVGLRLLLAQLPPGSTLDDALAFHRRLRQQGRRPCRCLDR